MNLIFVLYEFNFVNETLCFFISNQDDVPPRYADTGVRQSRARLEYDYGGSASQYGDAYVDRLVSSRIQGFYFSFTLTQLLSCNLILTL